jgi:DNA polymerase III epsilon subunit-like protein
MRALPSFHPQSRELLINIGLMRRLRQAEAEDLLFGDWQKLARWLQSDLRLLVPPLRGWSRPWLQVDTEFVSVNIEADASWTCHGERAVCLYFTVFSDSCSDDYCLPNVGLWASDDWEHREAFCDFMADHRPDGFASTYSDGNTDPDCPFWRDLPLESFQTNGVFDLEGFAGAIVAAFESLATLRPAIDQFLAEKRRTPPLPLVPELRKALVLDLETTVPGQADEIIEVGLILVGYDPESGEPVGILDQYEGLRDPGRRAGTGLPGKFTRRMLAGKKLNHGKIEELIAQADVIISHNAHGFDKPRFEKMFPSSKSRRWLCSLYGLRWADFGFDEANLEHLCERHDVKNRSPHRALSDALALLHVLARKRGAVSCFSELLRSEGPPKIRPTGKSGL